ncbi:hypothetical protein PR048_012211 [Dryococelus australis]|uniref:Glycolipid transfer protein domain-containing protein n=1 Tax=Dryococelus australis TaxID=614101 RepID=A0ABQ9HNQ9_9NEOP|nr:hypothetical protein PR048_012211 [Dryococelus australis]
MKACRIMLRARVPLQVLSQVRRPAFPVPSATARDFNKVNISIPPWELALSSKCNHVISSPCAGQSKMCNSDFIGTHYQTCHTTQSDEKIIKFICGMFEEYQFFQLMGSVFSFVASDVKEKIGILEDLRRKEVNNLHTFKKMVEFEKQQDMLRKDDYVSGCRTLLRLHRGLEFIREFLKGIGELQDNDKTSGVCQNAYNNTLAKHHPWVIRKSAVVAMYALPTRKALLLKQLGPHNFLEHGLEDFLPASQSPPNMLAVCASLLKLVTSLELQNIPPFTTIVA